MKSFYHFCSPVLSKDWWLTWIGIIVGCTIMAAGFVFFINPYNIVPGGVYGTCIVLHSLFPAVLVGTFGYMLDIPLMLLSLLLLGSKLGTRTIVAVLITPTIMNLLTNIAYPTREAMMSLDPSLMLGGALDLSNDLMLTCIIGAVMIGIGCGIVVRCQATTGGSDIVAMILQKYFNIKFSNGILLVDAIVVLFGLVVFGFGIGAPEESQPSVLLSFYSLIAIFVSARVLSFVINGKKDDKLIFVICSKPVEDLHRFILHELERSATVIKSHGLYTGDDKEMIFLVVSYKEVNEVKLKIKECDPLSFVVVTDAYDTYGEGWKTLPEKHELQPE